MTDEQKTGRAMAALETMATMWAVKVDLRCMVKVMLDVPVSHREDKVMTLVKQAHIEGLFDGRRSNDEEIDALQAELEALPSDKDAEIAELKEALHKEADRLEFVLLVGAFTMQTEHDHPDVRYQLLAQDEDENFVTLSGERKSFATRREAIDAAIAAVIEEGKAQAAVQS